MASNCVVVLVTVKDEDQGATIAKALVENKLAACVNIVPKVRSIYRWEGKICDEQEGLLIIKTRAALGPKLTEAIQKLHSYIVPEIVCLPIETGSNAYLSWIQDNTLGD